MLKIKAEINENWIAVESAPTEKTTRLNFILGLVAIIIIAAVAFFLIGQINILVDKSGKSVEYFFIGGFFLILIAVGLLIVTLVTVYLIFKDCHNIYEMIEFALIASLGLLIAGHFVIEIIWFSIQLVNSSGYLRAIYAIEIAIQAILLVLTGALPALCFYLLLDGKKECDVVINGYVLPTTFISEGDITAKIQCKELKGKKMCKIPNIASLE